MTATINASTTAGVVTTADTSGILQLQTNGTAALTVDASQNTTIAGTLTTTGVTTFAAGSAAAPAITTTGDTNTGIFFPAADTIAFAEGGVEAVRIDSSGNLLVATTSAAGKLNVAGQITATGGFFKANGAPSLSAATAGEAILAPDGGSGALLYGQGTNYDVAICQRSTAVALAVLAGTTNVYAPGNLLVGTTSTSVTSSFQVKRSGGNPVAVHNNGGTSGYFNQILFLNNAGTADIGYIARTNDNSVAYNTTSDYRLKENIAPMTGALATVQLLKPVTYKWKSDGSEGQGFIAHELKAVVPDCVTGEKDAVDADGNPQYQGIDTSFLVATLTAAIQELKAIVDAQGAEIAALKGATA